jgi:hypothetical protein
MAPDVLANEQQLPVRVEQAVACRPPVPLEGGLAQALGQVREELPRQDGAVRFRR